jgi:FAD/FMN-containing dehydrogenase
MVIPLCRKTQLFKFPWDFIYRLFKALRKEAKMIDETQLAGIVGKDNIRSDSATLETYGKDISFVSSIRPACVVKIVSSEQVSKIVNLAKESKTALIPVSSGAPHFRGDTIPGIGGAVVVDLSGMKKIIRIDRKNRVALFEPGVTFGELSAAVAKSGMRLNMPLLPRQTKSVAGSLLEREPVLMPKYHWDISDPLACTEIIFGTGDLFRTGAAAGSGTLEEQWAAGGAQKEAAGPSSVSWYRMIQGSQGTMGIVTWVSARCELVPKLEEPYFVGSDNLLKILDATHWLIRLRLINECLILNNTELALIMAANSGGDYPTIKAKLPSWILFFNLAAYDYLPEERMRGLKKDMGETTQRLGVEALRSIGEIGAHKFLKILQKPSTEPYWKLQNKGANQSIFFLTIYDKILNQIQTMSESVVEAGYPGTDLGIYVQPIVQGVNYHCEFDLFYNPNDPEEVKRMKDLSASATRRLLDQGAFFSRPYGETAAMIMNRDAASVAALKKVKAIMDPENIMNPGKLCF